MNDESTMNLKTTDNSEYFSLDYWEFAKPLRQKYAW